MASFSYRPLRVNYKLMPTQGEASRDGVNFFHTRLRIGVCLLSCQNLAREEIYDVSLPLLFHQSDGVDTVILTGSHLLVFCYREALGYGLFPF